jgi:hypothetical protein
MFQKTLTLESNGKTAFMKLGINKNAVLAGLSEHLKPSLTECASEAKVR